MRAVVLCLAAYERANGCGLIAANCACVAFSLMLMFHGARRLEGFRWSWYLTLNHMPLSCCTVEVSARFALVEATASHTPTCYLHAQMCTIRLAVTMSCHCPAAYQPLAAGETMSGGEKRLDLSSQNQFWMLTFDVINQRNERVLLHLNFYVLGNENKARHLERTLFRNSLRYIYKYYV